MYSIKRAAQGFILALGNGASRAAAISEGHMKEPAELGSLIEAVAGRAPDAAAIDTMAASYKQMLGFLPPRVRDRFNVTSVLDPRSVELQEAVRDHAMGAEVFDAKTVQLIVFAMLMMDLSDAALTHAIAARRAGASWEELQAIVSLCFLFRGLPAANRGASVLLDAMRRDPAAPTA
jgi:4-carboxymuconolactone decarboxylase